MRSTTTRILSATAVAALLPWGAAQAGPVSGQGSWETTLQARDINGDGTVDAFYDTVLKITWLADANAGAGSAFDTAVQTRPNDGAMKWSDAMAWVAGLNVYGVTGWRLPLTTDTGTPGCNWSNAGGTDCGYNVRTVSANGLTVLSEMAYMYYVTLGNLAKCTPDHTSCVPQAGGYLSNTGDISHLEWGVYWSGSTVHNSSPAAWSFGFNDGVQDGHTVPMEFRAWAVHDGDVPHVVPVPVPEPQPLLLMLMPLAATAALRRRQAGSPR